MANHPSRDELQSELLGQGLPPTYIVRLLAELDDHFEDLLEERSTSMGAARKLQINPEAIDPNDLHQRLGNPTQLAVFAAEQYHARSFWGRHPLVTYLLAPLPLLVACYIAHAFALWAVMYGVYLVGVHLFGWTDAMFANPANFIWLQAGSIAFISWYAIVAPPLTTAWLLCRTFRRNTLDWRWPVLGCALLATFAGVFATSYQIATEPNSGRFMIGIDLGLTPSWLLLKFLPKFALAMGIGLLLVKRAQRQLGVEA